MTAVFVHGVPETASVWGPLMDKVGREDAVAIALPGFGCDTADGFSADMDTYARWLADELAAFDEVDLVTHDWGAILGLRVLADRPENVRSWVSDMGDLGDGFRWHDTARVWQTPGDGEALIDGMVGASVQDRAALLESIGVPPYFSSTMAEGFDARMGAVILTLYRSAVNVGTEWGPGIDLIDAPGLLVESAKDPFRSPERVRRLAARTGAAVHPLPDSGHFWMLDATDEVAAALRSFWESPAV